MKASTLFALTVAGLLAVGTVVVSKQMGLFNPSPRVEQKNEPIKVLVAGDNLFDGITITRAMVKVRALRPEELAHYQSNKDLYLPATADAAQLRIPLRNIPADTPLLKTDLQDLAFADGLPMRLAKDTRAVNVDVPKLRAAGGLISVGDRVDVLMTSTICPDDTCKNSITQSAYVARGLKIVAKRNIPWTVLAPMPENQPLSFTLEANPYRAALIELASTKGVLTLLPTPVSAAPPYAKGSFAMLDSVEFRDEDQRVDGVLKGEFNVTEGDLERIFKLKPMLRLPPPPPPIAITHLSGTTPVGEVLFDRNTGAMVGRTNYADGHGGSPMTTAKADPSAPIAQFDSSRPVMGYRFMAPAGLAEAKSGGDKKS